jgi:hypothetical protein
MAGEILGISWEYLKVSLTAMSMWGTIISYLLLPPENGGQCTFWRSQLAIHQRFRLNSADGCLLEDTS